MRPKAAERRELERRADADQARRRLCPECYETYSRMANNSWRIYQAVMRAQRDMARGIHPWPHSPEGEQAAALLAAAHKARHGDRFTKET